MGDTATMIGEMQVRRWKCIAADLNGVQVKKDIGRTRIEHTARFAFKIEAEAWIVEQERLGFKPEEGWDPIRRIAMQYFGPSDSSSNAWTVSVYKEVTDD